MRLLTPILVLVFSFGTEAWKQRANVVAIAAAHPEVEHAKEGHHEGGHVHHEEGAHAAHAGKIVILAFGGLVIVSSLSFAMANSSNLKMKNFTLHAIDNVVCIFLAVMLFQAMDETLENSGIVNEHYHVIFTIVYALFALSAAIGLSYVLRGKPAQLAVFAAAAAHFVSFAFMHAAATQMEVHAEEHLYQALVVFIGVLIAIPAIAFAFFHFKQHLGITADPELMEKIDDIENDAGAMAAAISWTFVVMYAITGELHDVEESAEANARERHYMFLYAVVTMAICFFMITKSSGGAALSYTSQRVQNFATSFSGMCVAWAWLLWGKWYFHDHMFHGTELFGRVTFALVVSLVGMAMIACMSQMELEHTYSKGGHFLVLSVIGLLVGWSWEGFIDVAIESLGEEGGEAGEQVHVGHGKLIALAVMMAVVLPVHLIHFKPLVMKLDEGETA